MRGVDKGEDAIATPSAYILLNFLSPFTDVPDICRSIVTHVQTSLARQAYNLDNFGAYQAVALSARDDLLVRNSVFASAYVTYTASCR